MVIIKAPQLLPPPAEESCTCTGVLLPFQQPAFQQFDDTQRLLSYMVCISSAPSRVRSERVSPDVIAGL